MGVFKKIALQSLTLFVEMNSRMKPMRNRDLDCFKTVNTLAIFWEWRRRRQKGEHNCLKL